ncbi:MAG: bifunctional folylpolyglutamate synthase/dihydrofolate synthase [Ilumatobacteraceae bacterium]
MPHPDAERKRPIRSRGVEDAFRFLADHSTYEVTGRIESPSTARIERLVTLMGDPHRAYRVVHVTGTNGKGSTTQMITRLLIAHGLKVGTYTSPHLERVNERICVDCEPIGDEDLAEILHAVADLEPHVDGRISYFEILTAAAYRWFADVAVDVAVVEVGLLGRWDATNVVDADVAVLTNVSLDHTEFAGPTIAHIAREKSGIVKPGSRVVIGDVNPEVVEIVSEPPAQARLVRDVDFELLDNRVAVGGRVIDVRTPRATYTELAVPLHGAHQGDNALVALAAVEEFFDAELDREVVDEAMSTVRMPGRFEVLGVQPLVIVDGAHNVGGAESCTSVFFDDFSVDGRRILVVGALASRNAAELLGALRADEFDLVVCCTAPSPRATPGRDLARIARELECDQVLEASSVDDACARALSVARAEDAILVAGSLYVVGAARTFLRRELP